MKHKAAAFVVLLLLLSALPYFQGARAQVVVFFFPPQVGLGFNPSSVLPISDGTPIYTQGDDLWMQSYSNSSLQVQVVSPNGTRASGWMELGPGQLARLYTFGGSDPSGEWTLSMNSTAGPSSLPLSVSAPNSTLAPSSVGENLAANVLNQTYTLPPTQAYNIQACSIGADAGPVADFGVPGATNRVLNVSMGQNYTVLASSPSDATLTTWLELYSQYSYSVGGAISSSLLLVAKSPIYALGGPNGATESFQLAGQTPLRAGRYDLRLFERTASGLTVQEAPFLREADGSWLSLGGCTSLVNVSSQGFTISTNLDGPTSTWPRQLVTMYTMDGVESYSLSEVNSTESVIRLHDVPNGNPLAGAAITASAPEGRLRGWDAYNSAVYLLLGSFPTNVSLGVSFGGVATQNLTAVVSGPFSSRSFGIQAGSLVILATMNGEAYANATVSVASPGGAPVLIPQSSVGNFTVTLPPNIYTVTASSGGNSMSRDVTVVAGRVVTVSLELTPPGFPITLAALAAVAVAALVANLVVWRRYLERRRVSI